MVCLGNICRSPLAESVLKSLAPADWVIDSAGTSGFHVGEPPDPRTIQNGRAHGLDLTKLRGRQFQTADFDHFDHIFVMDHNNLRDVLAAARHDADRNKVRLLLDVVYPGEGREVPDPYYGGPEGFERVYQMLHQAAQAVVNQLHGQR
jgi:protein-tyrosine phosphatase